MELFVAFITLAFLEIVLGIDNIIFVSIQTNKLPPAQRQTGRVCGLSLALLFRVILLCSLTWMIQNLTKPLFTVFSTSFSVREIILIIGGVFLLFKSTLEIHHKLSITEATEKESQPAGFASTIAQIAMIDIVFSFDSILTAIGLSGQLVVMIAAVVVAMIVMIAFAGTVADFIHKNPTLEVLALSFLLLIGFMLVLEGFHYEIPKGYLYFAVFFSLFVEFINMKIRSKKQKSA